ncbi:MAG: hypothetical protein JSS51_13045 [Planctomycetes bacterium]|nr:hypothetical protein [Planctomycetota bacterium]
MNCGRCFYDLCELKGDRCPECGALLSEWPPVDEPFLKLNARLAQRYALAACAVFCVFVAASIAILPTPGAAFIFVLLVVFALSSMTARIQSRAEGVDLWPRDVITGCAMVSFVCVAGGIPGVVLGVLILWIRWKLQL